MANIRIDLEATVVNGQALTFKSPADCSQVTGLIIYYPVGDTTTSKEFKFVDAHGVDVGGGTISLFAEDVLVKVILDTDAGKAYVQNADTNAYLEEQLAAARSLANAAQSTAVDATALAEAASVVANGAAKIQFGTYKGTGNYGSSGKSSLTFNFVPQIVFLKSTPAYKLGVLTNHPEIGTSYKTAGIMIASDVEPIFVSRNGNTISWYSYGPASSQFNDEGTTYFYIALG